MTANPGAMVYTSLLPAVPVVRESVFAFLFETTYRAYAPDLPAYVDYETGRCLARGEVRGLSLKLAWGLRNLMRVPRSGWSKAGVGMGEGGEGTPLGRGDRVMFVSANSLAWPVGLFGCVAAGLQISFASPGSTPRELSWQYLDGHPRAVFVAPDLVPVVRRMFALIGVSEEETVARIWVMDDSLSGLADSGAGVLGADGKGRVRRLGELLQGDAVERVEERFDADSAEETVYLCYSSGTTGRPKGVETSHKNVGTVLGTTQALWSGCETEHDVYIALIPMYHMFGLMMLLHYPFMRGKPVVIMNRGFEAQQFCAAVEKYRVTSVCLVPPILLSLSTDPAVDRYDVSSITNFTSGGSSLSAALANKCLARFTGRGAKVIIIQGCGSTETTCPAQIVAPADSVRKFGSVGQLVPNVEARLVVEVAAGLYREAGEGEEGEMWMRGPTIAKGYLNNPEANASTYTEDGWYKSGDILRRDEDGYFYILDRKKEMLKYKGHQVAPAELEAVMMENPEIADVGVVGVKDEYSGDELPRAYVTPSDSSVLKSQKLRMEFEKRIESWFKGQVSHIKYLRGGVCALSEVPKSATGKVHRKDLREMAERERKLERLAVKGVSRL